MPDFQVIGVNPCTMFGMFAIKDKVLLLFRIGRILSLDFKEEALSISNEEKLADLFEKQDNDKKFIYAFQTTLKTNTKGLVAGDRKTGLHYFLDLDSLTLKWTRLSGAEDPTICSFHFAHQNKCLWCVCLYFRLPWIICANRKCRGRSVCKEEGRRAVCKISLNCLVKRRGKVRRDKRGSKPRSKFLATSTFIKTEKGVRYFVWSKELSKTPCKRT